MLFRSENWSQQNSGANGTLEDVKFVTPQIGWTVGAAVLKSTDGGIDWFTQTSPLGWADKIIAQDSNRVWILGSTSSAYTADGGSSWSIIRGDSLWVLYFLNADTGWAKRANGLYRTTNGGQSWELLGSPTVSIYTQFINACSGWTNLVDGVSKTTDGGYSWKPDLAVSVYHSLFHISAVQNKSIILKIPQFSIRI